MLAFMCWGNFIDEAEIREHTNSYVLRIRTTDTNYFDTLSHIVEMFIDEEENQQNYIYTCYVYGIRIYSVISSQTPRPVLRTVHTSILNIYTSNRYWSSTSRAHFENV